MEAAGLGAGPQKRSAGRRLADLFHGRPWLQVGALLQLLIAWLVIGYLGSLAGMLISAFWSVDALSGELIKGFTFDNFKELTQQSVYKDVAVRTIGVAAAATVTDALIAFPIAFYMAKIASPRVKGLLVVASDAALVLLPGQGLRLASMLSSDGVINWALDPFGVKGPGYGTTAVWRRELPLAAVHGPAHLRRARAHPRKPPLRLGGPGREAVSDLPSRDPAAAFPAVVAGSIFTFSLTLGDYITPSLVSPNTQFIRNVVFTQHTNNLPLASAFATGPIWRRSSTW